MSSRYPILSVLLALAACSLAPGDGGPPSTAAAPAGSDQVQVAESAGTAPLAMPARDDVPMLTFLDSSVFDRDLSDALRAHPHELHVNAPERFGLSHIPPRLEKWLSAVKDSGGTVKAQPVAQEPLAMRGLLGMAIDLVVALFDAIHQGILYGPAHDYNVVLYYRQDTGIVEDTVFRRRSG